MAGTVRGVRTLTGQRSEEGYREYKITFLIEADSFDDGPTTIMSTPGLFLPGAPWIVGNDIDLWVWCRPTMTAQLHDHKEGDKHIWWTVEQTFSNQPLSINSTAGQRCQDIQIDDPLLEPAKVSGTFIKYTEEATFDKDGLPIHTSSFEQVRGNQIEFDRNRPSVVIEQNVPDQTLDTFSPLVDSVNDAPLWGLPARTIKLSNVRWNKQYYGQCNVYYTRVLEFDIMYQTFDRLLPDEATKALQGHWETVRGINGTINITTTATGGVITAVAVGAPGSGYPKNSTIGGKLEGGTNGVVLIKTNANGEFDSVSVYKGGTGYSVGAGVVVIVGYSWVLENIMQGNPPELNTPDRTNPAHFKTYKDNEGNASKVILDGRGIPRGGFPGTEADIGTIFVAKYTPANFLVLGIPTVL